MMEMFFQKEQWESVVLFKMGKGFRYLFLEDKKQWI